MKQTYASDVMTTGATFPFDEVCDQIVRECYARNFWDLGITIRNHERSSQVYTVAAEEWKLVFNVMRQEPGKNIVCDLWIPGRQLSVYNDNSGPTYCVYVGDDWDRDRQEFMRSSKYHSKLDGKPRTYLRYSGRLMPDGHYFAGRGEPNLYLVIDTDLGREYGAEDGDPTVFRTRDVFQEFTTYFRDVVLAGILSTPKRVAERGGLA